MIQLRDARAREAIAADPRLSRAQREALARVVEADPDAAVEGLDSKVRPVVSAKLGTPRRRRRYALMRNGDPALVSGKLSETWGVGMRT